MYDYLIVGAGLYGAVFAHEMKARGKKVLVIDRRDRMRHLLHQRLSISASTASSFVAQEQTKRIAS